MRSQIWYIALLIGLMCIVRFSLSAVGYVAPDWLMQQLSIPVDSNVQMSYIIRVWAIRDIVIAVLVASANRSAVKTLLFACLAIDMTDIISAHLSGVAGLFNEAETALLDLGMKCFWEALKPRPKSCEIIPSSSNAAETWSLKLTAIAALVPESIALVLLTVRKPQEQMNLEKNQVKSSENIL